MGSAKCSKESIYSYGYTPLRSRSSSLVPAHYLEGVWLVGHHQLVKRGQQELGAVDESQLVQGERDILLRAACDASHPSLYPGDDLYQEERVIAPQIVEDNRYGCGLRAQVRCQVAHVMSGTSVFSSDVKWSRTESPSSGFSHT